MGKMEKEDAQMERKFMVALVEIICLLSEACQNNWYHSNDRYGANWDLQADYPNAYYVPKGVTYPTILNGG